MSDITQYYGGSLLALKGKDSLLIISDTRLGNGAITINKSFSKIYPLDQNLFLGLCGFNPDAIHLHRLIRKFYNLHKLESKELNITEVANLVSYILYQKRWNPLYLSPIVCGHSKDKGIKIFNMDCIGSSNEVYFAATGTAEKSLIGLSETLFKKNLNDEELYEVGVQIFLNSLNRDCISGFKAECMLINSLTNEVIKRKIRGRMD